MRRREFLTTSSFATFHGISNLQVRKGSPPREYYELRRYRLRIGSKREAANAYLRSALVPALNRAGLSPIGVFDAMIGEIPTLYLLIPHQALESVISLKTRLADDVEYRKAGAAFLDAPSSDPAFERIESSLLLAFEKMSKLEPPDTTKRRVFELRRYESHSERASKKKIEMFNEAGELALFRRIGFRPVFFGETIVGMHMPNLEYMITFDSLEAREKLWGVFRIDPEWKKMSSIKEYQDNEIVSRISSTMLNPAPYSQI